MAILISTEHRTSNNDSVIRGGSVSSPSNVPPFTPRASLGTSKTKLATPSAPGGIMYSAPRNGTTVSVSDIRNGWYAGPLLPGRTSVRIRDSVKPVFYGIKLVLCFGEENKLTFLVEWFFTCSSTHAVPPATTAPPTSVPCIQNLPFSPTTTP